jgi:hypothetical protein
MEPDRRSSLRYDVRNDVTTLLETGANTPSQSNGVNISYNGAYLKNSHPNQSPGKVTFMIRTPNGDKDILIERTCDILWGRTTGEGGCAVRFHRALAGDELARLAAPTKGVATSTRESLELAFRDYSEVSQEVRAIQSRQSQVFFGTLAAIATWVMGAVGLVLSNSLRNIGFWTVVGASLPYVLLTLGILASIETTRGVNLRRGFLAALTDYIRHGIAPPNYLGWVHFYAARLECRARMASTLCPYGSTPCWEVECDRHPRAVRNKPAVPGILDSFTAFSTAVYGTLYCITVPILMGASLLSLEPWPWLRVATAVGEGAFIVVVAALMLAELLSVRRGKNSIEAQTQRWHAAFRHCRPIPDGQP